MPPQKRKADVNYTLRMEESLRRHLERAAKAERRSLNQEIIHRLEQTFAVPDKVGRVMSAAELAEALQAAELEQAVKIFDKALKHVKAKERAKAKEPTR